MSDTATAVAEMNETVAPAAEAAETPKTAADKKAAATDFFNNKAKNLAAKPHTQNQMIPLALISNTKNVRVVFPVLDEMGHEYLDLIKMAISKDPAQRQQFVDLVEEHEAFRKEAEDEQTFLELAESIFDHGQIQAIRATQGGTVNSKDEDGKATGQKQYTYGIVAGGRRTAAIAYLFAKGMWPQGVPAVKAELIKADSKRELMEISIAENCQRRDFTLKEMGEIVRYYKDEEGLDWPEIAKKVHRSVGYLKDCYVLVNPVGDAPKDVLDKLERGEINKGQAVAVAKGKATLNTSGGKTTVTPKATLGDGRSRLTGDGPRRVIPFADVLAKIDETPLDNKVGNVARLTAFAEVIGSDYDTVVKESQARRDKAAAAAKGEKAAKGSKSGKK